MRAFYFSCLGLAFLLGSCVADKNYYLSPVNASSNPYHAIPMKSDSLAGAWYASMVINLGLANQDSRDNMYAFRGSIHRSNNFGHFQAFYGADLTLGSYTTGYYSNSMYKSSWIGLPYPVDSGYIIPSQNLFFGTYGAYGGINLVSSFGNGSEWRILGLEGSIQSEFGSYAGFRKGLPDTAANVIFRKNAIGSIGIYSDIISRPGKRRHGVEFGYKIGLGFMISPASGYTISPGDNILPLTYFSHTLHLTKSHVTGYLQINIGAYAQNMQMGVNYQLGTPVNTNRYFARY
jgi:hypothetical protein